MARLSDKGYDKNGPLLGKESSLSGDAQKWIDDKIKDLSTEEVIRNMEALLEQTFNI